MRVGLWGVSQKGAALSSIHSKRIKRVIKPRDYRHYSKRLCEWMLPECSRRRLLSWWKFKNESLTIIKAFKSFSNHCQINLFAWYGRKYRNNIIQRRNTRNTRLPRIAYTHSTVQSKIYSVILKVISTDCINVESLSTKETSNVIRQTQRTRCTPPQAANIFMIASMLSRSAVYVARNGLRVI